MGCAAFLICCAALYPLDNYAASRRDNCVENELNALS